MNLEQYRSVYRVLQEGLRRTALVHLPNAEDLRKPVVERAVDAALSAFERAMAIEETDTPGNTERSREQSSPRRKRKERER